MSRWARLTVNLSEDTAAAAKKRAAEEKRSVSAYLSDLIEKDLRGDVPRIPEDVRKAMVEEIRWRVEEAVAHYGAEARKPARKGESAKGS